MTARIRLFSVRHATLFAGMAVTLAGFAWLLSAQDTTPPGFRAYRLQHAPAGDIVPQLETMLSGEGSQFEIVVDRSGNRILVQGGDTAQRLAGQLIEAMDQPPAQPRPPQAAATPAVVRSYQVDAGRLDATLEELRKEIPLCQRRSHRRRSAQAQLLVVAPEETQRQIAPALQSSGRGSGARLANVPPAAVPRFDAAEYLGSRIGGQSGPPLGRAIDAGHHQRRSGDGLQSDRCFGAAAGAAGESAKRFGVVPRFCRIRETWRRVVQALDRPQGTAEQQTDLVTLDRADPQKVQRAVHLMQTGRDASEGPAAQLASAAVPQEAAAAPAAEPPAAWRRPLVPRRPPPKRRRLRRTR